MVETAMHLVKGNSVLIRSLIEMFGRDEALLKTVLKGTNLVPSEMTKTRIQVSAASELTILENIGKLVGDDWLWKNQRIWQLNSGRPIEKALINAPNCKEVFKIMMQFGHFWAPYIYYEQFEETRKSEDFLVFSMEIIKGDSSPRMAEQMARDAVVIRTYLFFDHILQGRWKNSEIHFTGTPHISPELYKKLRGCRVKFNANRNSFIMPVSVCLKPSEVADRVVFNTSLLEFHQHIKPKVKNRKIDRRVIDYLSMIEAGRPDVGEVANALGVSQRTLSRRLQNADTSFRSLLDASLKIRAYRMLKIDDLSRAEISERLGYNEQASFSRALKRWKKDD